MQCDLERFAALCRQQQPPDGGIGSLGEKQLHRVLKAYFEPRPEYRERPLAGYVADILNEQGVTEIQTRSFAALRPRLEAFLPLAPVRVVYPLPARKWVQWIEPGTGALSEPHLSPKKGAPIDAFYELIHLAPLLGRPGLSLQLLFFDAQELRWLNGWDRTGKRGSARAQLRPLALVRQLQAAAPAGYAAFLPEGLPDPFTAAQLIRAARRSERLCRRAIATLERCGGLVRVGKQGRSILFSRAAPASPGPLDAPAPTGLATQIPCDLEGSS